MIKIEFKPHVLSALTKAFPRSNCSNSLEKYRNEIETLVNQYVSYRTYKDELFKVYLLPISKLDRKVRITQDKICLDKWLRKHCCIYTVKEHGDVFKNSYSKVTFSHHVIIHNTLTEEVKMIIDETNDVEISEFQLQRLLGESNSKLFEQLFPTYKINQNNDAYDLLRVDRQSLKNFIVWITERSHYNDKTKNSLLQEANTILRCTEILKSESDTYGYFPMARKANSAFGRLVYKGLSVHSMRKDLRRAVIGKSFEYDMRSFASVWRFGYAEKLCASKLKEIQECNSIQDALIKFNLQSTSQLERYIDLWTNPKRTFEKTYQYIGQGYSNERGKRVRQQMFDSIAEQVFVDKNNQYLVITPQEREQLYAIAKKDRELIKNIKETMFTQEEQRKMIKEVFTAIGFGADLTSNKWYKTGCGAWKPSALQSIVSNDDIQNRIKNNQIIKDYILEQDLLNAFIKEYELNKNPKLLVTDNLLVNGRFKDSKLFSYLFQQFETTVMNRFIELVSQIQNIQILARIHDAVIVDKPITELMLIQDELRKQFDNPYITFNKEELDGWNQITTQHKFDAEYNHKKFIQEQEIYAAEGYASLGIQFEKKQSNFQKFETLKKQTSEYFDGTDNQPYDIDLDPYYDNLTDIEFEQIKARRNSMLPRPQFIEELLK